jgi:hypothetical protein
MTIPAQSPLIAALDRFAAVAGHKPATVILAHERRDRFRENLHVVGTPTNKPWWCGD